MTKRPGPVILQAVRRAAEEVGAMVYLIRLCPKDFSSAWAMAYLRAKSKATDLIAALSQKAKDEA